MANALTQTVHLIAAVVAKSYLRIALVHYVLNVLTDNINVLGPVQRTMTME